VPIRHLLKIHDEFASPKYSCFNLAYTQASHLDWIYRYIQNFKENSYDDGKMNRQMIYNKFLEIYQIILHKIQMQTFELPPNRKIIGRNKELETVLSIYNEQYTLTLWRHCTYILPNLPNNGVNKSLPK